MMASNFKKTARKSSSDPVQEKLRQHKSAWNGEVTKLISSLISFKRAVNGRGDPKLGIPPSNIKDPLPSGVGSYLNDLASNYVKIINDAEQIIKEQEHYSNTRKKPQNETQMVDDGFVTEASWWGSRFWAELPFGSLRKEKKENRVLRISLIKFIVSLKRELKELESDLVSTKADSIPDSVTTLATLYNDYSTLFVEPFETYLRNRGVIKTEESESIETPPAPIEDEALPESSIKANIPNYLEQFLTVKNDLQAAGPVLSILEEKLDDDIVNKKLRRLFKKLEAKVAALAVASNIPDQNKSSQLEKEAQEIWKLYQDLLNSVAISLQDNSSSKSFKVFLSKYASLNKIAGDSSLTKWVNTLRLKINPTNEDLIKLKAVNEVKKASQNINELLDVLENYEASMGDLINKINGLNRTLSELSKYVWTLGDRYTSMFRQMKKNKPQGRNVDRADLIKVKKLEELTSKTF